MTSNSDPEILSGVKKRRRGIVVELVGFLMQNKKWWLAPILVCILGLGLLVFFGGTGLGPFIYTLF